MSKSKGRLLAEWLRNLNASSQATTNTIADDAITNAKIADDAVDTAQIADDAVHTANLADENVTFAKLHTALVVTESDAISSNDNDITVPTSAAVIDYVATQIATKDNSDEITEGTTNLYFTNERVDDRVSSLLTAGTGITLTYDDTANTLTVAGAAQYGDSDVSAHLNTSTASSGEYLSWNGSDFDWATIPAGYTDSDVASYLSTNGYGTSSSIIASITDSAPTTLDTLNELAAALGDDANFSTTVTNSIGTKWTQDNTKISNWDTAYSWGNHASAGYLTLSGSQTITGTKTFSSSGGNVFLLNDTNATNSTDANIYFYFQANGSNLGYVGYGTSSNNYLYIYNPSAPIYLAGSSVLLRGGYEAWGVDNDGSGSGLDADLWDGNQFSTYLNQDVKTTSNPTFNDIYWNGAVRGYEGSNYIGFDPRWNESGYNTNEGVYHFYATTASAGTWGQTGLALYSGAHYNFLTTKSGDYNFYTNNNKMWHAGNDGSGSGLDADTLDGYQLNGGSGAVGEKIFNNQGRNHSTTTNFNSTSLRAGVNYIQGGTNGPTGGGQWYGFRLGLGNDYGTTTGSGSHYGSELYWSRKGQSGNNYYLYSRDLENGSWTSWVKMNAGYADSAGNSNLLSGYSLSTGGVNVVLRTQANGYILHQNWIQVGNGTGLYCPNGAYFYNDTTYGWFARSSSSSSGSVRLQTSNGTNRGWFYADNAYQQGFLTSGGGWGLKMDNSGNVTATGNVTAYSDIRLKEDIKPLEGALAKVLQLRGVQYTRKDTKEKEIGVIAQEIENILPEVVHISDSTAQEEGKETYRDIRSVDYGRMVSVLIEAIKEQQAQINELKEKLK